MQKVLMANLSLMSAPHTFVDVWERMSEEQKERTRGSVSVTGSWLWGTFGDDVECCIRWLGVYDQIPELVWETLPPPVTEGGDFQKRCSLVSNALSLALKAREQQQ